MPSAVNTAARHGSLSVSWRAESGHNIGDEDEAFHCPGGVIRQLRQYASMERALSPLAPFCCAEPSKWDSWKRPFEYYVATSDITSESWKIAALLHAIWLRASAKEFSLGGQSAISLMLSVLDSRCCSDYI